MFKAINKLLKSNRGFTLAEIAVSTAAMVSLVSIFALLPSYEIRLSSVEAKQKAKAIIQEVVSQIEDNKDSAARPSFTLNSNNITLPDANKKTTINSIKPDKITYTVTIEPFYIDALDVDNDKNRDEKINTTALTKSSGNVGRVIITVFWNGYNLKSKAYRLESTYTETTINNSNVFPDPP